MLSLRSILREAHKQMRVRSFATEVPQDDCGAWELFNQTCTIAGDQRWTLRRFTT
jgi:hypothetical protein